MKTTVSQRRAARAARKAPLPGAGPSAPDALAGTADAGALPPLQALTSAPHPGLSHSLASGGENLVRGNSNLQPLNATGHRTAAKVGQELANLGGPDQIQPSSALRTEQTAQDVSAKTGVPVAPPSPALESHALGQVEGEPRTPELQRYLADLMRNAPDVKIPGQGAMSNRPGESFNDFRTRALSAVRGLMQRLASSPSSRILVPTSTQIVKLIEAWSAAGTPDDLSVSPDSYLKEHPGKPGDIERFFPGPDGKWDLSKFKPQSAQQFPPGLYFMRHGETDSVAAEKASNHQQSRAQLISHVRSGNWKGARDTAKSALSAGHLSEDDVSSAVDEALPTAQDAGNLPPHELLSAVSAASPAKRAELMPVLHSRFGNLNGASPEAAQALRSHLGRLGLSSSSSGAASQ